MFALTDAQLKIVMAAAAAVLLDRRSLFLERCAAMLTLQGCGPLKRARNAAMRSRSTKGVALRCGRRRQ
jgi:hypothetical protein